MIGMIILILIYLLPTMVAAFRGHNNGLAIAALNIMTGFTGLGWIGALVWSCTDNVKEGK